MVTNARGYLAQVFTFLLVSALCSACFRKNVQPSAVKSLDAYINAAMSNLTEEPSEGSLWTSRSRKSNIFRDFKARNVNDIVTIRVFESTQAVATANAKNSRTSKATSGFKSLFGVEKKISEIPNLLSGSSDSTFEGGGSTTRNSTMSTTLSARVVKVLPNGYLVIEGVRGVRLNNEDQVVAILGVVRPVDISSRNVVSSASIAQMDIRLQGRGMVSRPIKPGWLYKILTGIMPF